jgi:hypothetical protein
MVYSYQPGDVNVWIPIEQADDYFLQVGDVAFVSHIGGERYNPPIKFRVVEMREEEQDGRRGVGIRGVEDGPQYQTRLLKTNTRDTVGPGQVIPMNESECIRAIRQRGIKADE